MDPGRALIVVGITLVIVILFNVGIYLSARGERTINQVELLRRAGRRFRNPWGVEDKMLAELSQAAAKLRGDEDGAEDMDEQGEEGTG
jgi:hypothetical protein